MEAGVVKEIKVHDKIFSLKEEIEQATKLKDEVKQQSEHRYKNGIDKGEVVEQDGHKWIWSKPLADVRKALSEGTSIKEVLRKYSPKAKSGTLNCYAAHYRSYLRSIGELEEEPNNDYNEPIQKTQHRKKER